MAAPKGNKNAHTGKLWTDALRRALLAEDGKKLRKLADKLIASALKGNVMALKEIGDRMEGKPAQAIVGPNGGAVQFKEVRRTIVKA
jgi:hypothetical protein